MLVQSMAVRLAQGRGDIADIVHDQVQDTLLAVYPAFVFDAEEAVEEVMWNHLRRQSALEARPTHVAVNVLAVGFLGYSDLQGVETRFGADPGCEQLIDGRAGRSTARVSRARGEAAKRGEVTVALAVEPGGYVVDSADHVDIITDRF